MFKAPWGLTCVTLIPEAFAIFDKKMKKTIQFVSIIITFVGLLFLCNSSFVYAAMSGDGGNDKANLYKEAERFVLRAKKLEKTL